MIKNLDHVSGNDKLVVTTITLSFLHGLCIYIQ